MTVEEETIELRVGRLRARGDELRALSDQMKHSATRASMLSLASTFDNFADWLEGRQHPAVGSAEWL